MKYHVYLLRSRRNDSFYVGYSQNLSQRLEKHNTSKSGYTSRFQPWEMVYYEEYELKGEAIRREQFLKKQKSRSFYEKLISEFNQNRSPGDC